MRESITYMCFENGKYSNSYLVPKLCRLCNSEEVVHKLRVIELEHKEPNCYYAWWDNEGEYFTYIFPHKGLVNMCFPYGYESEEELGRGTVRPVRLVFLEHVDI